jgi:hypothetical protein
MKKDTKIELGLLLLLLCLIVAAAFLSLAFDNVSDLFRFILAFLIVSIIGIPS